MGRNNRGQARQILNLIFASLARNLERIERDESWLIEHFPAAEITGNAWDPAVSHGLAGLVGFLAAALRQGCEEARPFLEITVKHLKELRSLEFNGYDKALKRTGFKSHSRGLSWCHGEISTSIIQYNAGLVLGDAVIQSTGLDFVRRCSARKDSTWTTVAPGLCHGHFGYAHLFKRLYQLTGDDENLTMAHRFLETAMGLRFAHGTTSAGFHAPRVIEGKLTYEDNYGFLDGLAGIGLVLIGFVSDLDAPWNHLLLLEN